MNRVSYQYINKLNSELVIPNGLNEIKRDNENFKPILITGQRDSNIVDNSVKLICDNINDSVLLIDEPVIMVIGEHRTKRIYEVREGITNYIENYTNLNDIRVCTLSSFDYLIVTGFRNVVAIVVASSDNEKISDSILKYSRTRYGDFTPMYIINEDLVDNKKLINLNRNGNLCYFSNVFESTYTNNLHKISVS